MTNAWAMRPLVPVAVTTGGSAAGYDPMSMLNDYAGIVWKSATGANGRALIFDFGSAVSINAALFFGCTDALTSWTLLVEAADSADMVTNLWSPGAAQTFLAGSAFPAHGRGVGLWDYAGTPPARRYWRFTIGNLALAAVTVARAAVGVKTTLERNFAFGAAFGLRDLGNVDYSAAGVLLRRRAAKLRTLGITFPAVHKDEVEEKVQPLIELAAGQEAIVIVTDPEAHAQRQKRCWIGFMIGEMGTIWPAPHRWEWRVNLVDLIPIPKSA